MLHASSEHVFLDPPCHMRVRASPSPQVLLVGGFCASRYVQARLRRALGSGSTCVVVPAAPEAAVVLGGCVGAHSHRSLLARSLLAKAQRAALASK